MNSKSYKAVIFDMDGTILDTSEDLVNAINYAMEQCGHKHDFTKEQGCTIFGSGVKVALRRALAWEKGYSRKQLLTIGLPGGLCLGAEDEALAEKLYTYYMPYYSAHNAIKTGPFPGVCEALIRLKEAGLRIAVVSNKPHSSVAVLAEKYFPGLFEQAIGEQSGIARKPAADMNMLVLQKMGLNTEDAVYVGDTEIDLLTARNSNMECIAVDWGFRGAGELKELGAQTIIHKPEELVEILVR